MTNDLNKMWLGVPAKETMDFAKNLGFCLAIQPLALWLGQQAEIYWIGLSWLISAIGGVLTTVSAWAYMANYPHWRELSRRTFMGVLVLVVGIAGLIAQHQVHVKQ